MRFIDPETLDSLNDGAGYSAYLRSIGEALPGGVVALCDAVFHDGRLVLTGDEPATGALRFALRNYVGEGWVVYDIAYTGVSGVEFIARWPGEAAAVPPPYGQSFVTDYGGGDVEDGVEVHRHELHREADGSFEHRLMTLGGLVWIIRFSDAAVTLRRA